jgi:hypothetical protein
MKKQIQKWLSIALVLVIAAGFIPAGLGSNAVHAAAPSIETPIGDGTIQEPYIIKTLGNLLWVQDQVNNQGKTFANNFFKQIADIDMSPIQNWVPIGVGSVFGFTSSYDGMGHKIDNMTINTSTAHEAGLFSRVNSMGGTVNITRLALTNVNIVSTDPYGMAGAVAGSIGYNVNVPMYILLVPFNPSHMRADSSVN